MKIEIRILDDKDQVQDLSSITIAADALAALEAYQAAQLKQYKNLPDVLLEMLLGNVGTIPAILELSIPVSVEAKQADLAVAQDALAAAKAALVVPVSKK